MHFYFVIKTKYQQLKEIALDRRVGKNNHNIVDRILNNVTNVKAASKSSTSNIEITSVNGVEKREKANLNSVHFHDLPYLYNL
jgi:hypothetical protein